MFWVRSCKISGSRSLCFRLMDMDNGDSGSISTAMGGSFLLLLSAF